jgi:hypothetical protein
MYGPLGPVRRRFNVFADVTYLSNIASSCHGQLIGQNQAVREDTELMESGIQENPQLNQSKTGEAAAQ